jgi:23S rRNA pseudouridine1911/1915/1917 synthase
VFVCENISDISRSFAQKLIENGCVTLNGKPVKKNHKVSPGQEFTVCLPDAQPVEILPQNIPLDIIYEDDDVIVVNKPRGMVVHPAPGHSDGTLVNALMYHCGDKLSGIGGEIRPGIVHRIDMDTSGLLIVAKNDNAHAKLSAQLSDRSLSRIYECVVYGRVRDDSGSVDAPIGRSQTDRKRMCVTEYNSRSALTYYQVIARYSGFTHLRCKLATGRTHQIRVHMAYIGHPLLGDLVYGRRRPEKGLSGQCLHARKIKFIHPTTGLPMEFETELPEYFQQVLSRLGSKID